MKRHRSMIDNELIRIGDKVRIRARGKRGIYQAEFHHAGQHHRRSLGTSRLDIARKKAVQLEASLIDGALPPQQANALSVVATAVMVGVAVQEYLDAKKAEGVKKKTSVKYREVLQDSFEPFALSSGVEQLRQLTPRLFEQFTNHLKKKKLAPKTVFTHQMIVKQWSNWCSDGGREYLHKNPFRSFRPKRPYVPAPFTPTAEQVKAILDAATGDCKVFIAIAAFAGLREEEIVMLSARSVDRVTDLIHVLGREGWTPKTGKARQVPIHTQLAAWLPKPPINQSYFLCAAPSHRYPDGKHHLNPRDLNEKLQVIAKKL